MLYFSQIGNRKDTRRVKMFCTNLQKELRLGYSRLALLSREPVVKVLNNSNNSGASVHQINSAMSTGDCSQ